MPVAQVHHGISLVFEQDGVMRRVGAGSSDGSGGGSGPPLRDEPDDYWGDECGGASPEIT